jgi:hypothetical protein
LRKLGKVREAGGAKRGDGAKGASTALKMPACDNVDIDDDSRARIRLPPKEASPTTLPRSGFDKVTAVGWSIAESGSSEFDGNLHCRR